jgi:hypothetical protein
MDPLVVFSPTNTAADYWIRGQLWDAILVAGQFTAGSEITFDGYTWTAITHLTTNLFTLFVLKS